VCREEPADEGVAEADRRRGRDIERERRHTDDIRHEHVDLSTTGNGGQAVFAMLGWPGWKATFAGHPAQVGRDSAGLLTVSLPPNASGRIELTYTPPGLAAGLAAAGLGLLGALALGWYGRRRKERTDDAPDEVADGDLEGDERAGDEEPVTA